MAKVKALLVGGPARFPEERRVQVTDSLTDPIKHRFGAGYEHFWHEGAFESVDGEMAAVFTWTAHTAIAE